MIYKCAVCDKPLIVENIRYHTADITKVFCDAYCSHEYHRKENEKTNNDT